MWLIDAYRSCCFALGYIAVLVGLNEGSVIMPLAQVGFLYGQGLWALPNLLWTMLPGTSHIEKLACCPESW